MKAGTDLGGIRNLEDLRQRCHIDADTGCWLWAFGLTHDGQPKVHAIVNGKTMSTTGGRISWTLAKGSVPSGKVIYRARGCSKRCLNPGHLSIGTKAEAGEHLRESGHLRGDPGRSLINSRNRRSANVALDIEKAREIRASDEPLSIAAARFGVSKTTIIDVRRMRRWKESGYSVFTQRAA